MKIYHASNPTEAHIICEWLKGEQIKCEVRGEGMFSLRGELPFGVETEPYIWLFDFHQNDYAQRLISEYQSGLSQAEDWHCPSCHEYNEGQFAVCWQCGTSSSD